MDDIKEKIKQALRHIWINKYRLFFCLLTLCCLFGLVHYFKSADSATASLSFNYSEAALGMNPNKTRFNAYEIVSDEVMERAIRRVGLQDSLTASQLAQCLYLSPEGTGSANGSEYISTNYYLSINTRKLELGSRKATDLLQSVCESYREIFQSNYCDNQSLLKEKLEVTSACEPYLRLNELEVRAEGLNRYLNARLQENKSFTDEANPDSATNNFTTLGKKINNLVDYDLPNAMAFVIEGGVARDPSMLTSILEYKNKIDDLAMRTQQAYYDADKKGISIYEKSMTSIMMIPTVDEDSEYYMSRTKTAMDALARAADASLADATDYQSEIVSTNYVIQKIRELKLVADVVYGGGANERNTTVSISPETIRVSGGEAAASGRGAGHGEQAGDRHQRDLGAAVCTGQGVYQVQIPELYYLYLRLGLLPAAPEPEKDPDGVRCRDAGQRMAAPRT